MRFGNPILWGTGAMGLNEGSMSQRLFAQIAFTQIGPEVIHNKECIVFERTTA